MDMKEIAQIRLENARELAKQAGGTTQFAARVDREPTQMSRIMGANPTKGIGSKMARHIESCFGKPSGWLDYDHSNGISEDAGAYHSNTAPVAQPIRYYRYPVVSAIQAGQFAESVVPYPSGMEDRHETTDYKAKGQAFWLEVKGDSMTAPAGVKPSIPEGSLVLVDTGIEAAPGKLVVAQIDESNEATFKKLIEESGQKYLKALNPAYPLIHCNGNCRIIGVAVKMQMSL
ncbi:LexA family protein [Vreelandella boliviensis]|uniref:LexA family protein n=1 Tax=Vreelandella boliviensis TaxID=223527 RepID=UPI001B8C4A74|nr:S24 family peptidase [Halomonas boliviensis]MBS3670170.1 XRE family transcriptional regulator [Halomonas boliviensis]